METIMPQTIETQTPSAQPAYFFALVDDEPRIHEFLVQTLREAGMLQRHESFFSPLEFLEFLEQGDEEPDIVLLDINFENAGLSGVDILPHIREDFPYLPVILLTGMDNDALREAEEYEMVYFIPKPVQPDQLTRMIRFYMGKSKKSSELIQHLAHELQDFKEYHKLLEEEIESLQSELEAPAEAAEQPAEVREPREKKEKAFQRVQDLVSSILQNSDIMPSFIKDLKGIFDSNYDLFKKVIEILTRFDVQDAGNPGLNIHKVKGTENVYSARLSKKVRLFFFSGPSTVRRRLLRLDTVHDTKGMDRWLRENYNSYAK
jgi:CheY-like chemotaxis protein/mRNA-degrading endonuclease RelE of RelBE toxin-antitoxin system